MMPSTSTIQNAFAADVRKGLSSTPKSLSSKYFYDDEGTRLFMEIMKLPEYYLTGAELEIFTNQTAQIYKAFNSSHGAFDLIELGAGDGSKTSVLIDYFLKQSADFTYAPIDISKEACDALSAKFIEMFPELSVRPHHGDYFRILESLRSVEGRRKILMFLGSNIGNFSHDDSVSFFKQLRRVMNSRELLFIGFDLQKDPRVIRDAYDDSMGVTAAFNLNLLKRINRELGGNFDTAKFSHYASYRPIECSARSYLFSCENQSVHIEALNQSFEFAAWEAIFMEISQKYSLPLIGELAAQSGFAVVDNFFDGKRYYCNSLWQPI